MTDKLMSVSEVAKIFDVTPATVRVWLTEGYMNGIKIGKGHYWRVKQTEVARIANARHGMESQHD